MMTYQTEQENFWAGAFGDAYIGRNEGTQLLAANLALFSRALSNVGAVASCIEYGANVGNNLRALKLLFPDQDQHAVEINAKAATALRRFLTDGNVHQASLLDFTPLRAWDLVVVKGVLIHIPPAALPRVYDLLRRSMRQYLLICEYYSLAPVTVPYRGNADRLFKRDFCGELLDRFDDLQLRDYGFVYHRDANFPQDDINWFLLSKSA